MGAKKEFPCGTLIALVSVVVILVSTFAGAVTATVGGIHGTSVSPWARGASIDTVTKVTLNDTASQLTSDTLLKTNDSAWASRPVKVNIQVDLESEEDQRYLRDILNEIEARDWVTSVFVTGVFALKYPELIKELENRGHYIGVYGW
jgi:hypothetical protein